MNKNEFVREYQKEVEARTGKKFNLKETAEIVDGFFAIITESLTAGEDVNFVGIGKFFAKENPEKERRNPMTGETILCPASKSPKFRAGKALKEAVNA